MQSFRNHRLLDQKHFGDRNLNGLERRNLRSRGDDDFGSQVLQHSLQPLRRRFDIEIGVAVAAIENPDVRHDVASAFGEKNRDGLMIAGAALENKGRAVFGETFDFRERIIAALILNGDFVSALAQSPIFEVFDDVNLHVLKAVSAACQRRPNEVWPDRRITKPGAISKSVEY